METLLLSPETGQHNTYTNQAIASFLENHLDEFGDKHSDIQKAIEYALNPAKGGMVLLGLDGETIIGAIVINATGMEDYIPSNILVYIAVHRDYRGKGIGKQLMQEVMPKTKGGIALHVEPNNPAKKLYEKLGFTNKYLEMRYINK
jgi:ribosomal-protein-alanine N-acetyltransferase